MPDPPDPAPDPAPDEPDHFFVGRLPDRLPDGGPRYKETPPDPTQVPVAEPWNAVTAALFVAIAAVWAVRLRGRFGRYPFLTGCLPILLAGGVGGTLYHAFRTSRAWFLLDVIPISLLGAAGAVYLTARLGRAFGLWKTLAASAGLVAVYLVLNGVVFRSLRPTNPNLVVNLSYASLVAMILIPLGVVLVRTRFRDFGWVAAALACFAHGWFCRLADNTPLLDLPMGTHWLWHTYGAAATAFTVEYFYRVEGRPLDRSPAGG